MKTYLVILSLFFFTFKNLDAGTPISFSDCLSLKLKSINATLSLYTNDFSPAWFNDIDLRTETNRFELERQQYSIRFSPLSFSLRNAQKDNFQSNIDYINLNYSIELAKLLKQLYTDWIDLLFKIKELHLFMEKLSILEDELLVREKMIVESESAIDRYIETNEKKVDCSIKIETLQLDIQMKKANMLAAFKDTKNIDIDTFLLSVESIASFFIRETAEEMFKGSADNRKLLGKSKKIESEMELESAENNQLFNFVQFEYRGPHENILDRKLSLMFSFRIPMLGRDKMKYEILIAENQENQRILSLKKIDFIENYERKVNALNVAYEKLKIAKAYLSDLNNCYERLEKNTSSIARSPLWLLSQQKLLIDNKMSIEEIHKDIYLEYINLLELGGYFTLYPEQNFLQYLPEK